MSENCTHDCSTCKSKCSDRKSENSFLAKQNDKSNVKKIIGVVSGKGGVGKSFVTSCLSVLFNQKGHKTAIIDTDITGPSIPRIFGLNEKATSPDGKYLLPIESRTGIKTMSINYLLENDDDPVVWRGPVIAGTVKQFYTDVMWGDVDYMFVDMPPGTGDVPLTVFQSLPLSGIIVVTSPQELVSMIVRKAVNMANMMDIPVLALVENMSYFKCPDCNKEYKIFGESNIDNTANRYGIDTVVKVPINPENAKLCDTGFIESINASVFEPIYNKIVSIK